MPYSRIGKSLLEFNLEIMQRKILLIISIFVFITFSQTTNAQSKKKSDAEFHGLRGKVNYVKEIDVIEKKFIGLFTIVRENFAYDYYFNTNGNLTKILRIEDGNITNQTLYKYDDRNNQRFLIYTQEDKDKDTIENVYDENGVILKTKGNLFGNSEYKYDDKVVLQSITTSSSDGLFYIENYLIDKNGNPYECVRINKDNKMVERTTYDFDDNGNLLKTEYYNGNQFLVNTTIKKYNDKNDIIEENFNEYKRDYEYTSTFKYKYDSRGNWIKKTEYNEEGKIVKITKREIEYYKD